jgi:hypothetical protein
MMNDGESASICEYYPDKKQRNTINGRYQQYHAETRNEGKKTSKRTSEESRNTFEDDTPYSGATTSNTQFTTRNSTNTEMGENYYNDSRKNDVNDGTTSRRDKSSGSYNQASNYDANPYSNINPEPYHPFPQENRNKSWCPELFGAAIASNDQAKSNPNSTMLEFNNHHEHHTDHRDDHDRAATGNTSSSVTSPTCYDATKQSGAVTNDCRSEKDNHRPHHHQEQKQQQPYGHYNYHAPPPLTPAILPLVNSLHTTCLEILKTIITAMRQRMLIVLPMDIGMTNVLLRGMQTSSLSRISTSTKTIATSTNNSTNSMLLITTTIVLHIPTTCTTMTIIVH